MVWKTVLSLLGVLGLVIALPLVASKRDLIPDYLFFDDFNYGSEEELEANGWTVISSHIETDTGEINLYNYARIERYFDGLDAKTIEYKWRPATSAAGTVGQVWINFQKENCYYSLSEGKALEPYGENIQVRSNCGKTFVWASIAGDWYTEKSRAYKIDFSNGAVYRNGVVMFSDYDFVEGKITRMTLGGWSETSWLDYVLIK